jgi:hypothetical protein
MTQVKKDVKKHYDYYYYLFVVFVIFICHYIFFSFNSCAAHKSQIMQNIFHVQIACSMYHMVFILGSFMP